MESRVVSRCGGMLGWKIGHSSPLTRSIAPWITCSTASSTLSMPKQFGAMLFTRFLQRPSVSAWMHSSCNTTRKNPFTEGGAEGTFCTLFCRVGPLCNVQIMRRLENHIDRFFPRIGPSVFGSKPTPADLTQCWRPSLSISFLSNITVV